MTDTGFHPLEIQTTRLTCELTIVPPQQWPDIMNQFEPMSAKIILIKLVGFPWVVDSVIFQGRYFADGNGERDYSPGLLLPKTVGIYEYIPVFMRDSARWAIQYASNRWEEVGIHDE